MTLDEAQDELLAYTLAHRDPAFVHQYAVDAITAQRAGGQTKPIALTFALIGLYLHVEKGFSGKQVQQTHQRLGARKRAWPSFALPVDRSAITALDVLAHPPGPARDQAIEAWCGSVWQAYRDSRGAVSELLREFDIR